LKVNAADRHWLRERGDRQVRERRLFGVHMSLRRGRPRARAAIWRPSRCRDAHSPSMKKIPAKSKRCGCH
jgi:hypothetical protein